MSGKRPRAWLVTAFPLWFRNGYAANVMSLVEADAGERIEGVLAVVPMSLRGTPECRRWIESFRPKVGRLVVVSQPVDLGTNLLRAFGDAVLTRRIARILESNAGLVHARGIRAAALCARVRRVPVVVDVRGDAVAEARLETPALGARRGANLVRWSRRETEAALERADAFVAVSDAMVEWLGRQTALRGRRIGVMPCPVDVASFRTQEGGADLRELTVCYLGGLQSYQGPALVAETMARLAAADAALRFWVVTADDATAVKAALAERGLDAEVECLDHAEVRARLCEADVGIVPREPDDVNTVSCPTKIGEYLAAGVPVLISSCVGKWPTVLAEAGVGDDLDGDAQHLADFVASVRRDRDAFRLRARRLAEERWSWEGALRVLDEVYGSAAKRGGRRREPPSVVFVLPYGGVGGAEKQTVLVAAGLRDLGHGVRVVVLKDDRGLGGLSDVEGIECSFLGARGGADPVAVARLVRDLRSRADDAVVCVNFNATLWGRVAAVIARVPTVVDWEHSTSTLARREGVAAPVANRLLAPFTDAVVACARAQVPWLVSQGHRESAVRVIPNGIRLDAMGGAPTLRVPGATRFAMVASLTPAKDHDTFVAAADRLLREGQDVGFAIVGDGPLRERVVAAVAASVAPDRFVLTGHVADVAGALASVDAVVLASKTEALPVSLIEAMAAGLPVVATSVGGVSELVETGVTGILVPAADVGAMTDAMRELTDPARREVMGRAAGEAAHRFDVGEVARSFAALLAVGDATVPGRDEGQRHGSDRVA